MRIILIVGAAVLALAALTGLAHAALTLELSKSEAQAGEEVSFTITGTESGAEYLLMVEDNIVARGTDADGGDVKDVFKMPDFGQSGKAVTVEARVTQSGQPTLSGSTTMHYIVAAPVDSGGLAPATETVPAGQADPTPAASSPAASSPRPVRLRVRRERSSSGGTDSPRQRSSGGEGRTRSKARERASAPTGDGGGSTGGGAPTYTPPVAGTGSGTNYTASSTNENSVPPAGSIQTPPASTPSTGMPSTGIPPTGTPPAAAQGAGATPGALSVAATKADKGLPVPLGLVLLFAAMMLIGLIGTELRLLRPRRAARLLTPLDPEHVRLGALTRVAERTG